MKKLEKNIVQKGDAVLRQTALTVPLSEITTPKIKRIINNLIQALETQDDGVAIAAPQIGVSLRIFVVSKKVEIITKGTENLSQKEIEKLKDRVYINPELKKLSRDKSLLDEGCLSVRYLYGKVLRSTKATITAYDDTGKKFTEGATGLLAQIFQHETDHLNGILFIDKANDVIEVLPQTNVK